jgi:hypothetical protein
VKKQLNFLAYPGMNIDGLAGEQSFKISGLAYDTIESICKVRMAWLSTEPLNASTLFALNVGWELATK